jgi:hypothetical protein
MKQLWIAGMTAAFIAACSAGTSVDQGDGGTCTGAVDCGYCSATCVNGHWECPPCAAPYDAGVGARDATGDSAGGDTGLGDAGASDTGTNDTGTADTGSGTDAQSEAGGGGGPCGSMTCAAGQYCTISNHPVHPPPTDGGPSVNTTYACPGIPASCVATPTCMCLQQASVTGSCVLNGGELVVTIDYP